MCFWGSPDRRPLPLLFTVADLWQNQTQQYLPGHFSGYFFIITWYNLQQKSEISNRNVTVTSFTVTCSLFDKKYNCFQLQLKATQGNGKIKVIKTGAPKKIFMLKFKLCWMHTILITINYNTWRTCMSCFKIILCETSQYNWKVGDLI